MLIFTLRISKFNPICMKIYFQTNANINSIYIHKKIKIKFF